MKFSLRLGDATRITPADAKACFAANAVFPGSGSLLGGRWIGYPQVSITIVGFLLTAVFGTKFMIWVGRHWSALFGTEGDPLELMLNLWFSSRWALLGILLFGMVWLWAFVTSLSIRANARERAVPGSTPPVIPNRFRT